MLATTQDLTAPLRGWSHGGARGVGPGGGRGGGAGFLAGRGRGGAGRGAGVAEAGGPAGRGSAPRRVVRGGGGPRPPMTSARWSRVSALFEAVLEEEES